MSTSEVNVRQLCECCREPGHAVIGGATRWNAARCPSESAGETFTSVSSPTMFSGAVVRPSAAAKEKARAVARMGLEVDMASPFSQS